MRRTFEIMGYPTPNETLMDEAVGRGLLLPEMLLWLHPPGTPPLPAVWVDTYRAIYNTESEELVTLFPGVEQVLLAAAANGKESVVISNKGLPLLENSLNRFGLRHYFSLVLGDTPDRQLPLQPQPAMFTQVIQAPCSAIGTGSTLMIGDTAPDVRFARNCGISSCWASYGFGQENDNLILQPTYRINSLPELLPLLQ